MALIQDTVGRLPYKLVDFDQHSYEAKDCFTRFMPKDKLDTAVRLIDTPSGGKALLANQRIVSAFETDPDVATDALVMGSDWPHAEGLREPAEMYLKVAELDERQRREFLRDDGMALFDDGR